MPDWDNTESRHSDEDAAWRDLIARFGAPPDTQQPVPWPEREDTSPRLPPQEAPEAPDDEFGGAPRADGLDGAQAAWEQGGEGRTPARALPDDPDADEHFIPPAPPPLPKLDPLAKGAWVALFGGPGYLLVATAAGWSVPGIAAFCAVAAFVTGVALLVLRLNDSDPKGPGDPGGPGDDDNGAVV